MADGTRTTPDGSLTAARDLAARLAEIRAENHQGDVSAKDIEWLCSQVEGYAQRASEGPLLAFDFYYDNGQRAYRVVAASVREAEEKAIDRHGEDWEKWVKVGGAA